VRDFVWVLVAAAVVTGGCMGLPDLAVPTPDASFLGAFPLVTTVDLAGTPAALPAEAKWQKLVVEAAGEPGSWLFIHRDLPERIGKMEFHVTIEATAYGDGQTPLALFTMPPAAVAGGNESLFPLLYDILTVVDADGEMAARVHERTYRLEILNNPKAFSGFAAAVGSTGAWTARITVELGGAEGNVTGPNFASDGRGISLSALPERVLAEPNGPAGTLRTSHTFNGPGWTHIEVLWKPTVSGVLQAGVRHCEYSLSAEHVSECGEQVVSVEGSGLRQSRFPAAWGRYLNDSGNAWIRFEYAQLAEDMDVYILHLPANDDSFPPGYSKGFGYNVHKDLFTGEPYDWNPVQLRDRMPIP
jgi:hypothetical protein